MSLVDLIGSAIDVILDESEGKSVGIVLSGGLDSSTVAVMADAVHPGLPTFTGYYDAIGFDEREYAYLVAHDEHHDIQITAQDFIDNFDAMVRHLRPPIMGPGTMGQYMVAKWIAQNTDVRVVLSGEGSDELFGGYARQLIVAGEPPPVGYEDYQLPEGYPTNVKDALDYDYAMLPDLLAVDDQMTSAWGLEARAPFTDQRIVDYGLALPTSERLGKRHLRAAVRGLVPDAIIDRQQKMGFPAPWVSWAQVEPLRSFIGDRLGYVPDPIKPWDRAWFQELCQRTMAGIGV